MHLLESLDNVGIKELKKDKRLRSSEIKTLFLQILIDLLMMSPWLIFYPPKRFVRLVFPPKFKSFHGPWHKEIKF